MEQQYHLGIKALITNGEGKFLVLKVNPEKLRDTDDVYWDIPGGRVQVGSTANDTLIREVLEETGLAVSSIGESLGTYLSNIMIPTDQGAVGLLLSVYQVNVEEGDIELSDEHTNADWVNQPDLIERLRHKYPEGFLRILTK